MRCSATMGGMSAFDRNRQRGRNPWVDPRLIVGATLVIVSVLGVWFVIAGTRQTTAVLIAARTLVPGEPVDGADLRVADVWLGGLGGSYLAAGAVPDDAVATRTVPAGELVPTGALSPATSARSTVVVIESTTGVPASVAVGTAVEIWSAPRSEPDRFGAPRVLVADAVVAGLPSEDAMSAPSRGSAVELVVPRAEVAEVLAATAAGDALSIVPAAGGR